MSNFDKQRRDFLIRALSCGMFAGGASGLSLPAWAMGQIPRELPPGRSIYKLEGDVSVDGTSADLETVIHPGSVIETGADSRIIFAVGKDAFILRSRSRLEMQGGELILTGFRLVTGKILSVFGKRPPARSLRLNTTVATIGIRGTGVYLEAEPELTYVCTCYGTADLRANQDESSHETVVTKHHDAPRYIHTGAAAGKNISTAPVINHSDEELELIETLVGRSVPFAFGGGYDSMRRDNY